MGGTSFDVAVVIDGEPRDRREDAPRLPHPAAPADDRRAHDRRRRRQHRALSTAAECCRSARKAPAPSPGPVCFGRGGTEPTVTDANVVLGRIDRRRPIGRQGREPRHRERARRVRALGEKLGLDVEETAEAILAVVNQRMAGRIRLMSIERGLDPRDFALVAFGGAGPVHGARADARGRHRHDAGAAVSRRAVRDGLRLSPTCATTLRTRSSARVDRAWRATRRASSRAARRGRGAAPDSEAPIDASIAHALRRHGLPRADPRDARADRGRLGYGERLDGRPSTTSTASKFGNTLADIPVVVVNLRTVVVGKRASFALPHGARQQGAGGRRRDRAPPGAFRQRGMIRRSSAATTSRPA